MMPDVINYLLSIRDPISGNFLCHRGGWQTVVPIWPPGVATTFRIEPLFGWHALISYDMYFGDDMVPNSFTATIQQYGANAYTGVLTVGSKREGILSHLLFITSQQLGWVRITSLSNMSQRLEMGGEWLAVQTGDHYRAILEALNRLETSRNLDDMSVLMIRQLEESGYTLGPRQSLVEITP